jgi:DNA modification methylase
LHSCTGRWQIKRDVTKSYIHPTQKPIALSQRAIKNSSKRGDIILDLFLGSGSTLIAAESLGRKCYGVEIDPKYVDGIVRRYIAFVGHDNVSDDIKRKYIKEDQNGSK